MSQHLSPEEFGKLFFEIDSQPSLKLSELSKVAGLNIEEDYIGADLSDEDLSEDNLSNANFTGANLSNADLHETNLSGAILNNADLSNANLSNANLSNADLSNANLSGANLFYANLYNSNLNKTNLSDANLRAGNLLSVKNIETAHLMNTNLTNVILGLSQKQILFLKQLGAVIEVGDAVRILVSGNTINSELISVGKEANSASVGGNVNKVQGDGNRAVQGNNNQAVLGDNNQVTQQNQVGADTGTPVTKEDTEKIIMIRPIRRNINTPFIGKNSPAQYIGVNLSDFLISQNLFISRDGGNDITATTETANILIKAREKIYYDVIENLNYLTSFNDREEGVKTSYYFEEYGDASLNTNSIPDRQRWIIRIIRITPRQTRISSLCRFYTNGVNLYIGIDSYFLGRIRWASVAIHSFLLLIFGVTFLLGLLPTLWAIWTIATNPLSILVLIPSILPIIISGLYLYFSWFPVVKALLDGESFINALKFRFHDRKFRNLFDKDDVLTYLKALLPFILERVKAVLESYGIKDPNVYKTLDEISERIKEQQINVVNNSGFMSNFQVGGSNVQNNN